MTDSLSRNCILSFIINYLQKNIDQYFRYAWQNASYDIGEPVDNFTGVIGVALSIDIIKCAVMTCDHFAFLHYEFCSHSYCFEHFTESPHLHYTKSSGTTILISTNACAFANLWLANLNRNCVMYPSAIGVKCLWHMHLPLKRCDAVFFTCVR